MRRFDRPGTTRESSTDALPWLMAEQVVWLRVGRQKQNLASFIRRLGVSFKIRWSMAETVYVLGAGINKALSILHFNTETGIGGEHSPPLANDFFREALRFQKFSNNYYEHYYRDKLERPHAPMFDYISKYWKLSRDDLKQQPFNIEECYTLIQLQSFEAQRDFYEAPDDSPKQRDAIERLKGLREVEDALTGFLADYLSEFSGSFSSPLTKLGAVVLREKAAVLTFNYDSILEQAIEFASDALDPDRTKPYWLPLEVREGQREPTEEERRKVITSREHQWHLPLAYGVKFDWINVPWYSWEIKGPVPGEKFYSYPENGLYKAPFLKLHGSFNWIEYLRGPNASTEHEYPLVKNGQVELKVLPYAGDEMLNSAWDFEGTSLVFRSRPLIITPVLHKNIGGHSFINKIWRRARQELKECKRLIVGGYSFPPTDFYTRKLFLEAFAEHTPEEIIVINPDTRVVQLVKDLCHFKKPVLVCSNLEEFNTLHPEIEVVLPPTNLENFEAGIRARWEKEHREPLEE